MAQIPQVVAPELTPQPQMNPRMAGASSLAVAGAAEQTASAADFGMQVAERIQKAQDAVALQDAGNSIDADIEKAHEGLANWTDYNNAGQLKQDTATALHEKYEEKYGNRPDLWRHIQNYLGQGLNSYDKQVDVKAADLTAKTGQAGLIQFSRGVVNKASTEPTLDGKQHEWAVGDGQIDLMAANGIINPVQAEQAKVTLRSQTIQTEVEKASNPMNAPEVMQAEMDRLKEYEGKGYVEPDELAKMQKYMGEAYKVALDRSQNMDVSQQVDAVVTAAKKDPTFTDPSTGEPDYLAMATKVDNNTDLSLKVRQHAREEFEAQDALQKRQVNERDQKAFESLDDRIGNPHAEGGALTPKEVEQRRLLPHSDPKWIPARVADKALKGIASDQRMQRVESMQERGMMMQEAKDKSLDIRNDLLMDPGRIANESELFPKMVQGLSKADARFVWATKAVTADPAWANVLAMANNSPLVYDTTTQEGKRKLGSDLDAFKKKVEDQKLTGSQITDAFDKELRSKEEVEHHEVIKGLLDNIWPVARNVLSGGRIPLYGLKTPPVAAPPARPAGVPQDFVWNEGVRQWQLPKSPPQ